MSELEMTADVETEEFADELSDEALDREQGPTFGSFHPPRYCCFVER